MWLLRINIITIVYRKIYTLSMCSSGRKQEYIHLFCEQDDLRYLLLSMPALHSLSVKRNSIKLIPQVERSNEAYAIGNNKK